MGLKDRVVKALALRFARGKIKDLRGKDKETGMGKVLKLIDGWKLVIVTLILFGSRIYDSLNNGHSGDVVGAIIGALGWSNVLVDPAGIGAAATGALAIWAIVSKVIKAQKQYAAGSSVSGLLSEEGYEAKAISDAVADGFEADKNKK